MVKPKYLVRDSVMAVVAFIVVEQEKLCGTHGVVQEFECVMDRRLVAHVDSEKCDCA
jgi:hypothetical protein